MTNPTLCANCGHAETLHGGEHGCEHIHEPQERGDSAHYCGCEDFESLDCLSDCFKTGSHSILCPNHPEASRD